jgi:mRNA interferase MazF
MTSQSKRYPTRVEVHRNDNEGWVVIDQIRTIDKIRIIKILDELSTKEVDNVKSVIRETFVD